MMKKEQSHKFDFGIDFQELILKHTVTDKKGYKSLELYEDTYFTLLSHQVVAFALKKYYKKYKRVPDRTFFLEHLRSLYFSQKKVFGQLDVKDRKEVDEVVEKIYGGYLSDGESAELQQKVVIFAKYVNFKEIYEKIDITNFESYQEHIAKLQQSISIGDDIDDTLGTFLVGGIKDRAHKRDAERSVTPTPYWQWNRLLNGKGVTRNALILVASEAKRFKTGFIINLSIQLMKRRKKVIYFDLENGEESLTNRSEQSVLDINQEDLLKSLFDDKLIKLFRKYKRIGAEIVIKRLPAYTTTAVELQFWVDRIEKEAGFKFDMAVVDYADLMGSLSNQRDENQRINDVYVDLKNFTKYNDYDYLITASHVTREGAKQHSETCYVQNDLAKCIDKIRHCEIAIGLNENASEKEAGILRAEIIEQRNGKPNGKVLFWVNMENQKLREFTRDEVNDYYEAMKEENPEDEYKRKARTSNKT